MAIIVDARKLACPQPVVLARKALQDANEVTVVVDNDVAKENVSRLATSSGCHVLVEEKADGTYLHLTKTGAVQQGVGDSPVSGPAVLLIASDFLGRGSEELGNILIRSFMHVLGEVTLQPDRIIFINSGVKLVTRGSDVVDDLRNLESQGVEILACGTCLEYYNLRPAVEVGRVSNMYDIASSLLQAGRIIAL